VVFKDNQFRDLGNTIKATESSLRSRVVRNAEGNSHILPIISSLDTIQIGKKNSLSNFAYGDSLLKNKSKILCNICPQMFIFLHYTPRSNVVKRGQISEHGTLVHTHTICAEDGRLARGTVVIVLM
jgi:hypothetical protein